MLRAISNNVTDLEEPLVRAESIIQGLAGDIHQGRRERIFNDDQLKVAKWIFPIIGMLTLYVLLCAI